MKIVLSDEDVRREKRYIIQERLGILCGHDEPDITQLAIAVTEADEWEARYMDSV